MARNSAQPLRKTKDRLIAVIDIGSNSVRLVVYRGLKRTPDIIFNERVLCGLGTGIGATGKMSDDSVNSALKALKRFSLLCKDMDVDEIDAVATAAVREAKNGPAFVKTVERKCGFKIKVISGKDEAKLSAYGVYSGFPGAEGLAGDLGGGSLELIHLEGGKTQQKISLPIGPLRLMGDTPGLTAEHKEIIKAELARAPWIKELADKPFYMVGGAWRALAHLHIVQNKWPLHVLHGYSLKPDSAKNFAWEIERKNLESLKGISEVPLKRLITLPIAARILREIIRQVRPSAVVTSGYGIREGLMFKKLNHAMRAQDPLVATTLEFGRTHARFPKHGDVLIKWTDKLYTDETPERRRLREAVCHSSEISLKSHPDFKADLAFSRSLVGRFVGVTHKDRAFVALALYFSYKGDPESKSIQSAVKILDKEEIKAAQDLGFLVRFGQKFTGGTDRPLKKTKLYQDGETLVLEIRKKDKALIGESLPVRFDALAIQWGLEPKILVA